MEKLLNLLDAHIKATKFRSTIVLDGSITLFKINQRRLHCTPAQYTIVYIVPDNLASLK